MTFYPQNTENITILGIDVAFKPGADMARAKMAARLVEERFEAHKLRAEGTPAKDMLLVFLALGLADELLQMKKKQTDIAKRIENLLEKIEKSL